MKYIASLALLTLLWLSACHPKPPKASPSISEASTDPFLQAAPLENLPDTTLQPAADSRLVDLETPYGTLRLELYCNTPLHEANFTRLIERGFYDSLLFHRVVAGFVIQGGDPKSRRATPNVRLGGSESGAKIASEISPDFAHTRGALAAARDDNPQKASSGSQFYIVQGSRVEEATLHKRERERNFTYTAEQRALYLRLGGAPQLDGEYTVFGRVYDGFEVLDKIAAQPCDEADRPLKDVWMKPRLLK